MLQARMFEPYTPRRFGQDYVEIKQDSSQLVNFMALVFGLKPLMDDWVFTPRLPAYLEMCERYGLQAQVESIFITQDKTSVPADVIGRNGITSTSAWAVPVETGAQGHVHVFLSRDPERLKHGLWYSMIVRDRVIWPPRMDILEYGRHLGYPECCVAFFRKSNDWQKYSFLYEIYKRSNSFAPLCNPLPKDQTFSYIYHMPCTFACAATQQLAGTLRSRIQAEEPELVEVIDRHLRLPVLVFRERKMYFFEGQADVERQRLRYQGFRFEGGDAWADVCSKDLAQGNAVEVQGQRVRILGDGAVVRELTCDASGFAPEIPFIVQFE
jgi:hypothetical protein